MNGPGLRERKKVATRQALHRAAVQLAVEHGLEHVTVEAIADAASVSRRTFSNYFSSKEEALVYGDLERVRRLLEFLHDRALDESPWTALTHAAERLAGETLEGSERVGRLRALHQHPALIPHQIAVYAIVERDLVTEIQRRMPDDPQAPLRARLTVALFLTTLRVATHQWIDHPESTLLETVQRCMAYTPER